MAVGLSVMGGGQVREMSVLVNEPGLAKGRPWPCAIIHHHLHSGAWGGGQVRRKEVLLFP